MGVWQVTNETQPYVGQWDATTDTFWDGANWAPLRAQTPAQPKQEPQPKAQDPWEALKSMF